MPNTINPPTTPAKTSSIGRSTPFFINHGVMMLSMVPRKSVHAPSAIPQPLWSFQKSQITAGMSTGIGPTCARQNMNTRVIRTPAPGTPLIASPSPASSAWMTAVPTTPRATARIALPARTSDSSPWRPAMRRAKSAARRRPLSPRW